VEWQAELNAVITNFPGFISLAFVSSDQKQNEWVITQRFISSESSQSWLKSTQYQTLIKKLKTFSHSQPLETSSEEINSSSGVTQIIFAKVNPDQFTAYQEWSSKVHAAEAKFPGFRGVYVQSAVQANGQHWITLLQFDTMEHLDNWLDSEERQTLLKEATTYVHTFESHRIISPYSGWFASIAKVGQVPPAWKQAMMVLLVLFPLVMMEFKYLSPMTDGLNISLATFIANSISVGLLTYPLMPLVIKAMEWWLSPPPSHSSEITIMGSLLVFGLYVLEILFFWNFV
jgi:antibiotic biosynthesis monooxygenase (ABM) superfamily enzyme